MSGYDSLPQRDSRLVCVTSASSFLGLSIVNRLISRGYSVRALVDSAEELEKLAEQVDEYNNESMDFIGIVVDVMNMESILSAIDGSAAVFHTSCFLDTAGFSGYTKHMARIETAATENLVEACARVSSVRRCVLTSSLLACIWQPDVFDVVDENCWSDETFCRERKLWLALSKTMMEKAAWKVASGRDVELVTICPALITGEDFDTKTPSSSIAYLKGGSEMYRNGVLAVADVDKVAGAHVNVVELGNGVECWKGYYQSLRPTQMDLSATSFFEPLNAVTFIERNLGVKYMPRRPMSDSDRTKRLSNAASPKWRLAPTRREQDKWDRVGKTATEGTNVLLQETKKNRGDPKILAAQARDQYLKLKKKLQVLTLGIGSVGVISTYVSYSLATAASFGIGVLGSLMYIRMLGNSVDFSDGVKGAVKGAAAQPRLLVPVVLVMIYNRWNAIGVPDYGLIHLDLIPMLMGFFTYKIATFAQAIEDSFVLIDPKVKNEN